MQAAPHNFSVVVNYRMQVLSEITGYSPTFVAELSTKDCAGLRFALQPVNQFH